MSVGSLWPGRDIAEYVKTQVAQAHYMNANVTLA